MASLPVLVICRVNRAIMATYAEVHIGRIHRGLESLMSLQGLGQTEGSWHSVYMVPQLLESCVSLKTQLPCRGPQNALTVFRITWHLVIWQALLVHIHGARSQNQRYISAPDKFPTTLSELSKNQQ